MNKSIIFDFNRTLYDPDRDQLMESGLEILQNLKDKGWKLFLIGKDGANRENLINELGLQVFFEEIIIKEEKDIKDLYDIKAKFPESDFYSVGDRIKKEIMLGNKCNFKTIWFKNGKFATEEPENSEEYPWKTIYRLDELNEILT